MKYALLSVVLGVLGGALGAAGLHALHEPEARTDGDGGDLAASRALSERLDRLEAAMESRGLLTARLEGRTTEGGLATLPPEEREALLDEYEAALAERLEPHVKTQVEAAVKALTEKKPDETPRGMRGRPRKELAEVAAEIGLSASEEDALRRIYADSEEKIFAIMAKPDGDVEQVRRDIDAFKNDAAARPKLVQKYMPKFLMNVGDMMAVEQERQTAIVEAVGEDKAAQLNRYDVVEANPIDMSVGFQARAGGR